LTAPGRLLSPYSLRDIAAEGLALAVLQAHWRFTRMDVNQFIKGEAKSNALSNDVPKNVFFKYTIVSDEDSNCAPLDPFIRIR
jgi:hypothetical protein